MGAHRFKQPHVHGPLLKEIYPTKEARNERFEELRKRGFAHVVRFSDPLLKDGRWQTEWVVTFEQALAQASASEQEVTNGSEETAHVEEALRQKEQITNSVDLDRAPVISSEIQQMAAIPAAEYERT